MSFKAELSYVKDQVFEFQALMQNGNRTAYDVILPGLGKWGWWVCRHVSRAKWSVFGVLVWQLGGNWDSLKFKVKMKDFGDFQKVYVRLSKCYDFGDWKSSRGTFEDILLKWFWCLTCLTWKGLESVDFGGKWA